MTKTEKNREEKKRRVIMPAGIRNKMVAAVSMLLVASIMMVSSTYAWFTLSTAPEVKGITTNVGANGNLEMMLLNGKSFNSTAEDLGVQSDIGDSYSKKDVEAANVTWGNLVDLSANVYGLTNAILNPAKLNIVKGTDGNSNTVNSTMLLAPSYGNDGRVIDVNTETYSGKWSNSAWVYADTKGENAFAGVRVLGTSSGVTKQLSAYRNALNAINSNSNTAKNAIATSLANNGQTLANILVQHIQDETAKFKRTDVETLKKLVDALQTANEAAGEAIKQAVLAYNLSSAAGSLSDDAVDSLVAAIKAAEVTELSGVTFAKSDDGLAVAITMPTGAEAAVTQWNGNSTAIKTASDNLTALLADDAKTEYAYDEFGSIMNGLIDKTHTKVAGVTNPRKTDMDTIVQYYTDNQRIDIVMLDGSGIYANIANLVGDYTASGFKVKVTTSASGEFYIYEPNCDTHISSSTSDVAETKSIDGEDTLIDTAHLIRQTASRWSEASPVLSSVTIKSLGRFTTPTRLFTLQPGEIAAIELYIWLEGQDMDCTNVIDEAQIIANLQFATDYDGQGGLVDIPG